MPKPRTEEQFPLLLVLVGDQSNAQTNKRLFGGGRFDGISSGASAIITEWPNYLSSCWLTALVCGITLFIVSILLTSCLTLEQYTRLPRCSSDYELIDNKTIHLVHTSHKWYPNQLGLVENITKTFPNYQIHVLTISIRPSRHSRARRQLNKNQNETENEIRKIKKSKSIEDLLKSQPKLLITHTTYNQIFSDTPLYLNWASLNRQTRIFAVRILQLWQHGGLSYDLLEHKKPTPNRCKNCTNLAQLKVGSYIKNGFDRFEKLKADVVSVDSNGYHMECKTPCHAFFGEVLAKLKSVGASATPRSVLVGPMYSFCQNGAIDKECCHVGNGTFQ